MQAASIQFTRVLAVLMVLFMWSCERHPPLNESQAEALANAEIARTGETWGRATSLTLSERMDERRFWVVAYAPNEAGEPRMVAVNYRSGWVRTLDPDDPLIHVAADQSTGAVVLLIDEVSRDQWNDELLQKWQGLSQEHNSEARAAGREAVYSLRQSAHSWQLVWGWNEGRGMRPSPQERRQLHGLHAAARWISLGE